MKIPEVGFMVIMDRNGFVPFITHRTAGCSPAILRLNNGLPHEPDLGLPGQGIRSRGGKGVDIPARHRRVMFIIHAPIFLKGTFWGGAVLDYNVENINRQIYTRRYFNCFDYSYRAPRGYSSG